MAEETTKPVNDTQGQQQTAGVPENTGQQNAIATEEANKQRAEFDKLSKELREERSRREQVEASFRLLTSQEQAKKDNKPIPIVDPVTGLIDERALTDVQKRVYETEAKAQQSQNALNQYLRSQEEREAYQAHPWLDKKSKEYNEKRYNLAVGIALASMVQPERFSGRPLDLKGAGDYISELTSGQLKKVQEEAERQAIEQLSPKEQAALEATGTAGRRADMEPSLDYDQVRSVTRKGGSDSLVAIMARLKALKTQT